VWTLNCFEWLQSLPDPAWRLHLVCS
jgi:hypothetical protein